jgi:hypothetical protein
MSFDLSPGRVSPKVALKAVAAVAERWQIQKGQRYLLLGVPADTANKWFASIQRNEFPDTRSVGRDVLERASHVVSIYDALHRLIGGTSAEGDAADVFFRAPNAAFGGRSLRDVVLAGDLRGLIEVRQYVDRAVNH